MVRETPRIPFERENRPPRLLLTAQPLDGGVARYLIALVEALPEGRFAIDVACPRESLTWGELQGRAGVTLHAIGSHRRPAPGDTRSLLALLPLVRAADVVHAHSSKAGFLARLAAVVQGRRGRCIFTPHGWSFWAADGAEGRLYVWLERLAAHWCRTIVTLSRAERDAGVQAGVGHLDQYRIVPNGVDVNRFAGAWSPVPGRILMVGRLAAPKRPDLALRALARVRPRVPAAELHLAGGGPLEPEARALARELGIEDAVRFLGRRDDVPALLREAAVALLASDYEGSPLSVIEAMATGVPVVATAAGGVDELVADGTTGLLAPPRDADALGEALVRVLSDPAAGPAMGAAGKRAAHERLSTERMVAETVALYEEALADSG